MIRMKEKRRRVWAWLLAAALAVPWGSVPAQAAQSETATFAVESESIAADGTADTVILDVRAQNCPPITNYEVLIVYDGTLLDLKQDGIHAKTGTIIKDGGFMTAVNPNVTENGKRAAFINGARTTAYTPKEDDLFCQLEFNVLKKELAAGAEDVATEVNVLVQKLADGSGEKEIIYTEEVECKAGTVTLKAPDATPPSGDDDKPTPPSGDDDKPTPPSGDDDKPTPPGGDDDKPTPPSGDDDKPTPPSGDDDKPTPPSGDDDKPTPEPDNDTSDPVSPSAKEPFEVTKKPNGETVMVARIEDGRYGETVIQPDGTSASKVTLPLSLCLNAVSTQTPLPLPIPAISVGTGRTITLTTSHKKADTPVIIPLKETTPGTVVRVLDGKGGYTIIREAIADKETITISLADGAQIEVIDASQEFKDVHSEVQGQWAKDSIDFVVARELFRGVGDMLFEPDRKMNRAMAMTVLGRFDGQLLTGVGYEEAAVAWAQAKGISDGSRPKDDVTREELADMLYRYAGSPALSDQEAAKALLPFSDAGETDSNYTTAMAWCVEKGIINGADGKLLPGHTAKRSEVAAMVMRYCRLGI